MKLEDSAKYNLNNQRINNYPPHTIKESKDSVNSKEIEIVNYDELFNDSKGFDITPKELKSVVEVNEQIPNTIEGIELL